MFYLEDFDSPFDLSDVFGSDPLGDNFNVSAPSDSFEPVYVADSFLGLRAPALLQFDSNTDLSSAQLPARVIEPVEANLLVAAPNVDFLDAIFPSGATMVANFDVQTVAEFIEPDFDFGLFELLEASGPVQSGASSALEESSLTFTNDFQVDADFGLPSMTVQVEQSQTGFLVLTVDADDFAF